MSWIREANAEPIPGYRLIQPLGSGGFGEVWKCEAPGGLNKAIKFVYGSLNSLDVEGVRAEQEWKALQRIKEVRHPFVCSVERIDNVSGELVIVMELAERTLHDLFQEHQSAGLIGVPRDDLLRYLRDAAEALDYMNDKHNLQHLDVKPRNLFIIGDRVKVADFGLVKHLQSQGVSGPLGGVTPLYAPPETLIGKVSAHSDQYSLGIVYQEMLTGHRPFVAKNIRMLAQMHLQSEPDLRALPEADRPIVARALAKDPAQRYASCMSFVRALFKARAPVKFAVGAGKGNRPKSIADTMEDMLLASRDRHSSGDIDLAAITPPPALPRSVVEGEEDLAVCEQGVTVVQPETGVLRPTLIIGLGHFGRKALLELRCRFLDRLGDLHKLPLLRFVCVDTDPEAVNTAILGAPEVALTRSEVHHLPLQAVGNYRRRSLEHLSEWLPREKLYAMPRSLQTQGSRAWGRLAFAENQQRLIARLRRDLQEITRPEALFESVNHTGLALCNSTPRVYVIAAAGGGTSGLLPDLGYALRRLLGHLRHPDGRVTAFLFGGALQDPATPKSELANVYATLTELNHFSDPAVTFAAQYGAEGQRLVDEGTPFHSVYLLPLAHRSPEAVDETVAHLGSYLFHELTTPVGLRLEQLRLADQYGEAGPAAGALAVPVRSFGTYAVWFPRGLLLHLAARQACRRMAEAWVAADDVELVPEVRAAIERTVQAFTTHHELTPEAIAARLEQLAQAGTPTDAGTTPGEVLAGVLAKLEEQALQPVAQGDPGNWAKQALGRVRDWVGSPGEGDDFNEWRKARLARVLLAAAHKLAEDWEPRVSKEALELMGHPGARLAAAETALARLQRHFAAAAEKMDAALAQHAARTVQAHRQAEAAAQECVKGGSGFLFFGGRSRGRQLREFLEQLGTFAQARLKEEQAAAARHCLHALAGRLADRLRDLGFCRQRLRHLQQHLEQGPADPDEDVANTRPGSEFTLSRSPLPAIDSFWQAIRQSSTARVVLPEGAEDLEQAALRFLQQLHADHWQMLDRELHDLVLAPRGGLHGACVNGGDLTRQLAAPLLEEASKYLNKLLPQVDVAQILTGEVAGQEGAALPADSTALKEQAGHYLDRATPLLARQEGAGQDNLLLIPASAAGKQLGEAIAGLFKNVHCVRVPGQADLMFLREQGVLSAADLRAVLRASRAAYEAISGAPVTSPHARFDMTDWLPLES